MKYVDPVHLRHVLKKYYSEGEIRTMCFDLGIEYESVPGRGKSERVDELVYFAQRTGRLDHFAAYVRQTRSFIQLKMTDTLPELPETVSGGSSGTTINVTGDFVQGDKMEGDNVQGDKITVGNISGSQGLAIGRNASATVTINQMPPVDDPTKQELEKLITSLNTALAKIPADRAEDAEAVAAMAQDLMEKAAAEKPNKAILKITGEGLKQAAQNIADIVPDVVKIAGAIVTGILSL